MPDPILDELQRESYSYFLHESNPRNGLVRDKSRRGWPASIAAVGMALAADPVGVERGLLSRRRAVKRALAALRFFARSPQGPQPEATGHQGFYYHFLDMRTGRRAHDSELSTIDTALLRPGADRRRLLRPRYEGRGGGSETADALYRRVDWRWALNGA